MTTPKKIKDINDKIIVKYENACDIISAIATYEDVSGKMGHLIEMQMYIRRVYMTEWEVIKIIKSKYDCEKERYILTLLLSVLYLYECNTMQI